MIGNAPDGPTQNARHTSLRRLWRLASHAGAFVWSRPLSVTPRLATAVTVLAAIAAVAVGVAPAATYIFVLHARQSGMLDAHALLYAAEVAEAAQEDPALWNALADPTRGAGKTVSPDSGDDPGDDPGADLGAGPAPVSSDHSDPGLAERRAIYARSGRLIRRRPGLAGWQTRLSEVGRNPQRPAHPGRCGCDAEGCRRLTAGLANSNGCGDAPDGHASCVAKIGGHLWRRG